MDFNDQVASTNCADAANKKPIATIHERVIQTIKALATTVPMMLSMLYPDKYKLNCGVSKK